MEKKAYVHITQQEGEHSFIYEMPVGASLGQAADAAFKIFKTCDDMYREAIDKEKKEYEEKQCPKDGECSHAPHQDESSEDEKKKDA